MATFSFEVAQVAEAVGLEAGCDVDELHVDSCATLCKSQSPSVPMYISTLTFTALVLQVMHVIYLILGVSAAERTM
jgi:hypothetical protein